MNEKIDPNEGFLTPIKTTLQKYSEARYFLYEMMKSYHDGNKFLFNLNSFIQSIRSITFYLQAEENKPSSFEDWYEEKQDEMRKNQLLRKFKNSRDIIVHKSSLESKSTAWIGSYRGHKLKLGFNINVSPFEETVEVFKKFKKLNEENPLFISMDDECEQCLGVERNWLAKELGEEEILSESIKVLDYMGDLISEAHT